MVEIYTDGASRGNPGKSASSFVVAEDGKVIYFSSSYIGIDTNNVAEYKAIIAAMKFCIESGIKEVIITSDSKLVISQLTGAYRVKSEHLKALYESVKKMTGKLNRVEFKNVRRGNKFVKIADKLCNIMLDYS